MAAFTDFFENKLWDWFFRGQALGITGASAGAGSGPTTLYVGLFTTTPTDSSAGTEVAGGSYARVSVASTLANWSGTQAAGSTTASTGTSGGGSNNAAFTFPAPTATWGAINGIGIFDAATGGNLLMWSPLVTPRTVNNGDSAPSFGAGQVSIQLDN